MTRVGHRPGEIFAGFPAPENDNFISFVLYSSILRVPEYYRPRMISDKNHVRRSVSSIQTSIKLVVATSLWRPQIP
jgi:hypothetical protein